MVGTGRGVISRVGVMGCNVIAMAGVDRISSGWVSAGSVATPDEHADRNKMNSSGIAKLFLIVNPICYNITNNILIIVYTLLRMQTIRIRQYQPNLESHSHDAY